ncbi:molybdopterin-dependent oxidoreductase [Pedobacter sp. R-06]|uniref:molybdopterin-dependent oxidoreductase n=1 Tax=Pedobacter sp. R-06 TaxID=3404051 RepID=UPI003CF35719
MKKTHKKKVRIPLTVEQKIKRRNFISFSAFFALGGTGIAGWKWLLNAPEETAGITAGTRAPLRRALNSTELFFRNLFSNRNLVRTYPKDRANRDIRINSLIGIEDDTDFDPDDWKLQVIVSGKKSLNIHLAEITALPKTEIVFDFKCVEGWDQIQYWGGVSVADFISHFNLDKACEKKYIGLETPNGEYYVGLERESFLHPQTILAYEMNGKTLTMEHGAPLRLIVPVKYGIKNLKRIGTMTFSNRRPRDYWAEQGYDYYSGL